MRETYTTLQTIAHGYTQTKTSDTTVNAFIKHEIGITTKFIFGKLQG